MTKFAASYIVNVMMMLIIIGVRCIHYDDNASVYDTSVYGASVYDVFVYDASVYDAFLYVSNSGGVTVYLHGSHCRIREARRAPN